MQPTMITVHHSLTKDSHTVSWNAIRKYHINTLDWQDIGYHFGIELIDDHYEILVGRMLNEVGAHVKTYNLANIGICLIGNFDLKEPSREQWSTALRLCKSLMNIYDIAVDRVFPHRHFNPYKSCPGEKFDFNAFRDDLQHF